MNEITITVPMEYNALARAADMFHGLAVDFGKQANVSTLTPEEQAKMKSFNKGEVVVDVVRPNIEPHTEIGQASTGETGLVGNVTVTDAVENKVINGVELDADNIPWDERIHAPSKKTLVKTGQWKKKRNVDPVLVEQVEAELRAAMDAPCTITEIMQPDGAQKLAAAALTVDPADDTPPPPPPADSNITTVGKLMSAATAAGKTPDEMLAAVKKVGLDSVPMLGVRPDLIPDVATHLGL